MPVLAELRMSGGARFVELAHRLGTGRETLRRTLDALLEAELVRRNPGHGHPLRPEYVLSGPGHELAPACEAVVDVLRDTGLEHVGLRKWSIPIVLALGEERRFGELRRGLGATPRALSLALRDLERTAVVERRVEPGYPPSTLYRLTATGRQVRAAAGLLGGAAAPTD